MRREITVTAFLAFALFFSCRHADHHEHDHEDMHHAHTQLVAYSPNYELYAECGELEPGKTANIALHLTRLSDFKPEAGEPLKLRLITDESLDEQSLGRPQVPGIYTFGITPQKEGVIYVEVVVGGDTLRPTHLHIGHGHHHHHHHHAETEGAITFTKEQSWKCDFATAQLTKEPFGRIIKATAQVLSSQGDQRQVAANTGGIVAFTSGLLVEGSRVEAGQRLFRIESGGMADGNMAVRYREAATRYERAKADYERKQRLADDRIVSRSSLEASRSEYETAKAEYDNIKQNFTADGSVVTSPISGYITGLYVSSGSYVESGRTILTVSQGRDLSLRAEVPARYMDDLRHLRSANIELKGGCRTVELSTANTTIGQATAGGGPLIPVTLRVAGDGSLLQGSFVKIYLRTGGGEDVLAIPNSGIVEEMGQKFVFVQITPEQFEKRPVTAGATDGLKTEIVSGVSEGERVVTRGAIMLKLAQGAGKLDPHAGHVH